LIAALGVLRLPDLYSRMYAASKASAVRAGLIIALSLDAAVVLRAIIGVLFLISTTPVSPHLLARAACLTGCRPA
jgi:multicomponent Na+:H+ antiporter subunit G